MSAYPVTPRSQTSYMRGSQPSRSTDAEHVQIAPPGMQQADLQQPPLYTPASQESLTSVHSIGSSDAPQLQASSSNVSQLTNYTDSTAPIPSGLDRPFEERHATSHSTLARVRTPDYPSQNGIGQSVTSPMSVTSPVLTNGTKRTASGHVKNAPSLPSTPMTTTFAGRQSRTNSISSTGSRAGEIAMTLKTRLGYAMTKVQNGWEHNNINEVEHLAAQRTSPNRHSMSHLDYYRRPISNGFSNGTARISMHESHSQSALDGTAYPPSKRHSGIYASFMPSSQPTPRLQPAPDIRPTTGHRHYHTAPSSQTTNHSNMMSPPRTPVNGSSRRPPTIRTDVQTAEDERDALQALFQLASPHNSQFSRHNQASQASSSQASPLRSEFATPRKVTFARSESDSSARRMSSDESISDDKERENERI